MTSYKTLRTGALAASTALAFAGALALTGCGGGLPHPASGSLRADPSAAASPAPSWQPWGRQSVSCDFLLDRVGGKTVDGCLWITFVVEM